MSAEIVIRLTKPSDYASVHVLVQTIADETFADLFASQVPIGEANWGSAWLEVLGEEYLFTVLATKRVRFCPGDDAKA
jgi:hypothetical protein